jgi:hypothetical protein
MLDLLPFVAPKANEVDPRPFRQRRHDLLDDLRRGLSRADAIAPHHPLTLDTELCLIRTMSTPIEFPMPLGRGTPYRLSEPGQGYAVSCRLGRIGDEQPCLDSKCPNAREAHSCAFIDAPLPLGPHPLLPVSFEGNDCSPQLSNDPC